MLERCPKTQEACPYYDRNPPKWMKRLGHFAGCTANTHHEYYPARDYVTPLENAFRELPENKTQLCRWEHDIVHLEELEPPKPTVHQMVLALTVQIPNYVK